MSNQHTHNLKLAGGEPAQSALLADYVQARLGAAAQAYWTALFDVIAVPWNDAYSKSLGVLCEMLAERDDLNDSISRTSEGETGVSVGQKGEMRKHPLYTRLNQIEVHIHNQMKAFGMTPAGLARLHCGGNSSANRQSALVDFIG